MGKYVINDKEMSEKKFQIWLGKVVNLGTVKRLKGKGYTKEKISEITGLDEKLVDRYMKITIDEI